VTIKTTKPQQLTALVSFADLRQRGIFTNWSSLRRAIDHENFPHGIQLGPNRRAWFLHEVEAWIASRPAYTEPVLRGGVKLRNARKWRP
jgi:Prophage CP4-57 regulatory protein (AlpA)